MNESAKQNNPWLATRTRTGAEYDAPYAKRTAQGIDVHGEANLVLKLLNENSTITPPYHILDAGCGTGRIGIELSKRGCAVIGVDLDDEMLLQARKNAPHLSWHTASLADIQLHESFDCILMAGNVMIFVTPGTQATIINNMAAHLKPSGFILTAFQLSPRAWPTITIDEYDQLAADAGLTLVNRWATWAQNHWTSTDRYAVSLHQKG